MGVFNNTCLPECLKELEYPWGIRIGTAGYSVGVETHYLQEKLSLLSCNCTQIFGEYSKGYNFVMDRPYAEDATEAKGMIPELKVKHANDNAKQH